MRLLLFLSLLFLCYSRAEKHTISCETTAGDLEIVLDDALSPLGVARVLDLVDADFFNEMVLCGFSINKSPARFLKTLLLFSGTAKKSIR